MPDVRPFRGYRYDAAIAGSLATLICPPYDVIPPTQAEQLLLRNPRNIVRLELGPGAADAAAAGNRYSRAAATLDTWIADGTLGRDGEPCLYVYEQGFTVEGQARRRCSFFAAVRLTPWDAGEVLPHEHTLSGPKRDRLALLEATHANISPIYALCDGGLPGITSLFESTAARMPDAEATDEDGVTHRLWIIADDALIARAVADLAARPLYIADGHHRYETALAFAARHSADGDAEGPGYVLMAVSPVDDPGLVVLPTHRLLHGLDAERLAHGLSKLQEAFQVSPIETGETAPAGELLAAMARQAGDHVFGLYTPRLSRLLRPRSAPSATLPHLTPALRGLDVAIMQELLFGELFGLTPDDLEGGHYVDYTRDAGEALRRVDEGTDQLAVLLNPTPPSAILDVARAGAQMPQKSTYFYPKLATGLVLRRW